MVKHLFLLLFTCVFAEIISVKALTKSDIVDRIMIVGLRSGGLKIAVEDRGYQSANITITLTIAGNQQLQKQYLPSLDNGVWTTIDRTIKVNLNDLINFSVFLIMNKHQYSQILGNTYINKFVDENEYPHCTKTDTQFNCKTQLCRGELIFSENFSDVTSVLRRWQQETMFPQEPDYPFNAYLPDAVHIKDNTVKITPILTESFKDPGFLYEDWDLTAKCTGQIGTKECYHIGFGAQVSPPVISGKITTRKSFYFKYGRIEVVAKLPVGDWLIPEINLEPYDYVYGRGHYRSGIIRIAFAKGNQKLSNTLYGGPICYDSEPHRSMFLKNIKREDELWGDSFHNYTLIWKPDNIEVFIDGENYGTVDEDSLNNFDLDHNAYKKGGSMAPFDRKFYISLGVRVGGIHDFEDGPEKPWKNNSPKAMMSFWRDMQSWHPTWNLSPLVVASVKVYSL